MSHVSGVGRVLLGALVYGTLAGSVAAAQAILPPSLELRVPKPPTVGTGETGSFLAYELHVTNFSAQSMTLKRVDVLSGSDNRRVIATISDSALVQSIARPGIVTPAADRPKIAGG